MAQAILEHSVYREYAGDTGECWFCGHRLTHYRCEESEHKSDCIMHLVNDIMKGKE